MKLNVRRSVLPLVLLVALTVSIVALTPAIPKVHAQTGPELLITPASRPAQAAGTTLTFNVSVANMPSFGGYDVYVRTNNAILAPTTITLSTFLPAGFENAHCVNNAGTSCDPNDGVGIAHEAFASFGLTAGSGTLFTITYSVGTGSGTNVAFPETVTSNTGLDFISDSNGFNITGVPEVGGQYGTLAVPDFSVSSGAVSPASVLATNSGTSTVTVTSLNGFAGAVSLTANPSAGLLCNAVAGVTLAAGGTATSALTCSAATGGDYTATVTGTGGTPTITHTSTPPVTFHVIDFSLLATPITTLATIAGSTTVGVQPINGFTGTVTFAITAGFVFPSGCSGSFTGAVLSVTCGTAVAPFSVPVTGTTGTSPNTLSRSTTASITIQDFSIACGSITTLATVAGTSNCTVTPINGFSGTVTFTAGAVPAGCTASFTGAVLSVTCSTGVAPFSVPVTGTTGTAPNTLSRSASSSVTIQDFSIAGPAITTLATVAGTSTVAVTPINGFSGAVTFAVSSGFVFPTGCSGSFTGNVLSVTCATGVAVFTVPVTGTSGGLSRSTSVSVTIRDFSIAGPAITTLATVAGTSTVVVTPINGFSGAVTFVAGAVPAGCTASFTGAVLSVNCSTGVAPFSVPVTGTTGTAPNTLSRTTSVSVTVQDFSIAGPAIATLATVAGSSTVVVTPINGFTGSVTFVVTTGFVFPTGCSGSFTGNILSVTCATGVAVFTVPVTGTSGGLSRSTSVSVTIRDFSIAGPAITTLATVAGTSTVVVTPINGFSGAVTFVAGAVPAGCTASFTGAVLSVTCATGVAVFSVPVTGTSGGLSRTTSVAVTVQDFSVSASPSSLNIVVGTPQTSTLSFTAINGFSGVVTFSTSAASTGCTASVSGTVLTVSCTAVPSPATFTLTITGTTGSAPNTLSRTTTVSVSVGGAPTFTVSLGAVTPASILATNSGTSTVTVTSVNGFAGAVSLSANPSTGLICNAVAGVTLTAGGTATSALTCSAATGADRTATVTGSGGTPVQNIPSNSVTFHVVDFSVSANPSSLNVVVGTPSTSTLSFTAINGFSGTVTFSTSAASTGCTASVSGTVLTVSCTAIPSPATFTLTITGTTGTAPTTLARTTTVSVAVAGAPTFTVSLGAVAPASILATNSGTSAITVTSVNGFAGAVSLTANPSTGLICNAITGVTLVAGGSATSALTCHAATGADYTSTVTGSGGTPVQNIPSNSVTFHVVDFSVSASPSSLNVVVGTPSTSTLSFTAINGFSGTVAFSTSAAPSGCTASVSGTVLTVSCTAVPTPATFTLTITGTTGTAPNTLARTTTVSVSVGGAPTFTVSLGAVTPASVLATTSGTSTITVTSVNGFAGAVSLTANPSTGLICNAITGVTLVAGGTANSALNCHAATGADYTATVTGSGGTPVQNIPSNSVTFHVVDFSIACGSITTLATVAGTASCVVTAINGFTGSVTFTAGAVPSGCTASFTGAVLSVACATGVAPFTVPVTGTTGTAPNTLARSATASVTVQDFSVSATPSSLTIIATGPSQTSTLSFTAINGFSGAVAFSTSTAPTGCTAGVSGTVLTVSCTTVPTPSGFTLTVTGTTGTAPNTLSRTTTVSVTVTPPASTFAVTSSRTSIGPLVTSWQDAALNFFPSLPGTATISVTAVNGFTGTVTLSISAPAGLSASLNTTSITFTAGGRTVISATLTVSSTAAANYSVTITAASTGFTSQTVGPISVSVVDFGFVANPSIGPLVPGSGQTGSSQYTITGQNGVVTSLSLLTSSSGLAASLSSGTCALSATITNCTGTLTVTAPDFHGPYTIGIFATGTVAVNQGDLGTHSVIVERCANVPSSVQCIEVTGVPATGFFVSVSVTVHVPDFEFTLALSPSPNAIGPINPGPIGGTTTVVVKAYDGFVGTVTFTATAVPGTGLSDPSHVTTTIAPTSFTFTAGGATVITLTLSASVNQLGTYHVIVAGASAASPNPISGHSSAAPILVFAPGLVIVSPQSSPTVAAGSTVIYSVNAVSMPSYGGYDVSVRVDPTVLGTDSIDISVSSIPSIIEVVDCVNGGFRADGTAIALDTPGNLGCGPGDGLGIAHSSGFSSTGGAFAGDGTLFAIHYVARASSFTVTASPSTIAGLSTGMTGTSTITIATTSTTNLVIFNDSVFAADGITVVPHSTRTGLYGGFTVALSLTPSAGLSANIVPSSITLNVLNPSATAVLSVSATATGTYTVIVTGMSPGLATQSVTVTVILPAAPSFTVTSDRSSIGPLVTSWQDAALDFFPSLPGTSLITVTALNGFTGTVTLSIAAPAGLSAALNATSITFTAGGRTVISATLTVSSTAAANYSVTVTGLATGFTSQTAGPIAVTVVDFGFVANPSIGPLVPGSGQTGSSAYTITGQNGVVTSLSLLTSSSGLAASLSSGTCALSATITNCTGTLTVTAPDFHGPYNIGIFATGTVSVNQGDLGTHTVIVERCANVPSSQQCFEVTGVPATGDFVSVSVTVHVPDFEFTPALSPNPNIIGPIVPGPIGGSTTVVVKAYDGFVGTVTFTATAVPGAGLSDPSHVTATISPTSFTFTAGGSATASLTLHVTVDQSGTYHIIVAGTSPASPFPIAGHTSAPVLVVAGSLLVLPLSQGTAPAGSTVTYSVTAVGLTTYAGFDISIRSNAAVLSPDSIDLTGSVFPSFFVATNCVNGGFYANGTAIPLGMPGNLGCFLTGSDGLGVAHLAVVSLGGTSAGDGLLFLIHYIAQASAFAVTASPSTITGAGTSTITVSTASTTSLVPFDHHFFDANGNEFNSDGSLTVPHSTRNGLYGGFTVTLGLTSSPGLTASISPTSVALDVLNPSVTALLTVSAPCTSVPGSSLTTVVTGSSPVTPSVSVTVTVLQTTCAVVTFTVTASPNMILIEEDDNAASTITVTALGTFTGQVCLTATGANVLSPTISPTCVTLTLHGTAQATLTVSSIEGQTPSGTYTITITGTSGTLPPVTAKVTVVVLSDLVKMKTDALDQVSLASNGGVQTWTITLRSRALTTQYVMVTISGATRTGTRPFTQQSTLVTLAAGATVTFTVTHTFTNADVGPRLNYVALAQFGSTSTSLNQISESVRHGHFTVVA